MEMISEKLTETFIQRNIINPAKKEIYKTGIKLILSDIINISLVLVIGLLIKSLLYGYIYLLLFWTVRRFSGGFHAKTYWLCRCVMIGTYCSIVLASHMLNSYWVIYTIIFDSIAIITMSIFAPVRHPNKSLTNKEIQANKLFSMLTTLLYTTISIILVFMGCKTGLVISLTLLAITILMYIGLLANRKEGIKNEKSQ